ncbi:MAG: C39 family peptidase [Patescibacteria group bacterium]|jgi:uncharacterized protein YvpB
MTKKKIILLSVSSLAIIFIGWVVLELASPDVKGKGKFVKRAYFKITDILPVKPAIKLAVPYHRQQHALSCEVASLLMALKYRGVDVTENQLIQQLPISDSGRRTKDNTWGDPNLGFVGNINGSMPNIGYGVYEQPLYDLALKYRDAKIINNATPNDLIYELINGNPVVVWGVVGRGKNISWKTPEGKVINAKMDEHARTLIGYTGSSDNPQLIILLDPIFGEIRLSAKDFLANWTMLNKRALVVY